jgi:hypothetical protein
MITDNVMAERSKPSRSGSTVPVSSTIDTTNPANRGRTVESHAVLPPSHRETHPRRLPDTHDDQALSQWMAERWSKIRQLSSGTKDELETLEYWLQLGQDEL